MIKAKCLKNLLVRVMCAIRMVTHYDPDHAIYGGLEIMQNWNRDLCGQYCICKHREHTLSPEGQAVSNADLPMAEPTSESIECNPGSAPAMMP